VKNKEWSPYWFK